MEKINRVALVGGTHGNEFTGVYLIKKFDKFPGLITRASFKSLVLLANPLAFQAVKRYIDKDLNRCFASKDLQNLTIPNSLATSSVTLAGKNVGFKIEIRTLEGLRCCQINL